MEPARKRQRLSSDVAQSPSVSDEDDAESTDFKLAMLQSLYPDKSQDVLLDYLLAYAGSVDAAANALSAPAKNDTSRKRNAINGYQSSLSSFATSTQPATNSNTSPVKSLTKKGRTLHLYVRYCSKERDRRDVLKIAVAERYRDLHAMLHSPQIPLSRTS